MMGREKANMYLQEFIPDNTHDTHVTVIGDKAFAVRRKVRKDDFRASGSCFIDYDPKQIDFQCIGMAIEVAAKLQTQSIVVILLKIRMESI